MQPYHVDHHHHYLPDYWALPGLPYHPLVDYHYHLDPYYTPYQHHDPYIYEPALGWFRSSKSVTDQLKSASGNNKTRPNTKRKGTKLIKRKHLKGKGKKTSKRVPPMKRKPSRTQKGPTQEKNKTQTKRTGTKKKQYVYKKQVRPQFKPQKQKRKQGARKPAVNSFQRVVARKKGQTPKTSGVGVPYQKKR